MKSHPILARAIELEAKLDTHLFGVRRDPMTGEFVNDDGTPATAGSFKTVGGAVKAAGAATGIGAALAGHQSVMKNFGGAGGVGQAYRNLGRNALKAVGDKAVGVTGNLAGRVTRAAEVAADSAKKFRGIRRTVGLMGKALVLETVQSRTTSLAAKADEILLAK